MTHTEGDLPHFLLPLKPTVAGGNTNWVHYRGEHNVIFTEG